jgi:integrase
VEKVRYRNKLGIRTPGYTKISAEATMRVSCLVSAVYTIAIEGTVVRMPGEGPIVQPHTKSKAGMRTIKSPSWLVRLLQKRHASSHGPWVFPSTRGTLRDPDNTRKQLRDVIAGFEWAGLHPHAFRHLVAVRLDRAGLSARDTVDYLGYERISRMQDVYMSRKATEPNASAVWMLSDPTAWVNGCVRPARRLTCG